VYVIPYRRLLRPARTVVVATVLALVVSSLLSAQSGEYLDRVLDQDVLLVGQGAYLALSASGYLPADTTEEEALRNLQRLGWAVKRKSGDDPITLGEYSQLLMRVFELPGGMMYQFFKVPRYALRELAYREFVQGRGAPGDPVSGVRALRILGRFLDWKEENP
jgi:hypothetical protein